MADRNIFSSDRRSTPGSNRITSMQILDLTDGQGNVSVTLKSKRTVTQVDDQSELKRLQESARRSPWTDSRLGRAFAKKSLNTRKLKDPVKELQRFTDSMTRR